jgi:predicted Zn-dependent protease
MPDNPGGGNTVGNFTLGPRWSKTDLTFQISKFSNTGLSEELIEVAVEAAFGMWSSVTPLTFQRVESGADIDIRFESGNHHDGHPFGGPFGVLAHAFFPEDGRAHFDDAETWAVDFPPGNDAIDLISVAAHEFGHILGLEHTNVAGALMFPDYTAPQRFLAQDDINRIQSLYPFS